jgi:ABC-2 type transport system permease protein
MNSLAGRARLLRLTAETGFQEFTVIWTWRSWLFGWFLRVVAQVVFFTMLARVSGAAGSVEFILIGNIVLLAALESIKSLVTVPDERRSGTLPLLLASPSNLTMVLMGRSIYWVPEGLVTSLGALVVVAPLFDVPITWSRLLALAPLLAVVSLATYGLGMFLASLVFTAMGARNLLFNLSYVGMMTVCGVNVPTDSFPGWVRLGAAAIPLTPGLAAVRALLADAPAGTVAGKALLALGVGACWLALGFVRFQRWIDRSRRDGSVDVEL